MLADYNILIVEDELISMEYLKDILGFLDAKNIFEASSASQALEIAKTNILDLVFMDINIQGAIDGIECASLLNKQYFIPIIFTTAYGDTKTINEAREENIFGYLIKPFHPSDVEACINIAFRMIKQAKELLKLIQEKEKAEQPLSLSDDCDFYFKTKTLFVCNNPVLLTKKELELLNLFCKNINKNISYEYLKKKLWSTKDISDSTVRDTVSRLKKKIPNAQLENISNFGYILKSE